MRMGWKLRKCFSHILKLNRKGDKMKRLSTFLVSCFLCLGALTTLIAQTPPIALRQNNTSSTLTAEDEKYIQSIVDYSRTKPSIFAETLVYSLYKEGDPKTNKLQTTQIITDNDEKWVIQHTKYWGDYDGYNANPNRQHRLMKKSQLTTSSDIPLPMKAESTFNNWYWGILCFWYGGEDKWSSIKDRIKQTYTEAWVSGYSRN